jgi:hypothetical protein
MLLHRGIALSIDLDYFNTLGFVKLDKFFNLVVRAVPRVPTFLVNDHADLVPFFNQYDNYSTLINVDHHSDLMSIEESKPKMLTCGNWVGYVPYKDKHYIWLTPNRHNAIYEKHGCCSDDVDFWEKDARKKYGWKNITVTQQIRAIKWTDVNSIGIALSEPCYTEREIIYYFIKNWYWKLIGRGLNVFPICQRRITWLLQAINYTKERTA